MFSCLGSTNNCTIIINWQPVGNAHQAARYRTSVQREKFAEKQTTQELINFQESDEDSPRQFQRHQFVDAQGKKKITLSGQQLLTFMES
jgi:hypothetical protein